MFPEECLSTKIAFGSTFFPVTGKSSGRLLESSDMLNRTQCTQVPIGASGSSTMRAKDCVPEGGSFQARAGEIFLPVQAYLAGMDCPFMNASLVSSRDMVASSEGVSDCVDAGDVGIASRVAVAVPTGA